MKAAVYRKYGPPEVLQIEEVENPIPRDNEVLVHVRASTVCTPDWRLRQPSPRFLRVINGLWAPKIQILGMEFAGRIEAVGRSVAQFKVGDDVFGSTGLGFGAHAEYLRVPEAGSIALKPSNMSYEEAAAVMFGGTSALHFLRLANVGPNQHVLVYGASGSVGVFAVQLAKHFGAHVTGVCSGANRELVKSLGADTVVDYTREDFSNVGREYDVIIDTVGKSGYVRSARALKRGGVFAQVAPSDLGSMLRWMWASITGAAKVVGGMARIKPGDQALLKQLIEQGKLRTVIDRRYPLEDIRDAHRYAQSGRKRGHVVIVMDGSPRPEQREQ